MAARSLFTRDDLVRGGRNFTWLLAGNYVSYGLSLLTVVLIARQLGPRTYGAVNSVVAYVALFGFLKLPGFDKVFVRESAGDTQALSVLYPQVLALKLAGVAVGVVAASVGLLLVPFSGAERVSALFFISTLLTQSLVSLMGGVFQAREDMKWMPIINLVRQSFYLLVALVALQFLGVRGVFAMTVVLGVSYWVGLVASIVAVRRYVSAPLTIMRPDFEPGFIRSGVVFSISSVLVFLYTKIDILMVRFFIGSGPAGLYTVALNMFDKVNSPFLLLTSAFFPSAVRRLRESGHDHRYVLRLTMLFALTGVALAVAFSTVGSFVVRLLFGAEYEGAIRPFVILLWSLPAGVAVYPLLTALQATGYEAVPVKLIPVRSLMNLVFNTIFIVSGLGISGVALSTVVTSVLYLIVFLMVGIRATRIDPEGRAGTA